MNGAIKISNLLHGVAERTLKMAARRQELCCNCSESDILKRLITKFVLERMWWSLFILGESLIAIHSCIILSESFCLKAGQPMQIF